MTARRAGSMNGHGRPDSNVTKPAPRPSGAGVIDPPNKLAFLVRTDRDGTPTHAPVGGRRAGALTVILGKASTTCSPAS